MVRRYARLIRAAVARVAGDQAVGVEEDVEQQVLMALWKVADGEQEIRRPSSYIYRAAVRETVRILRKERRHQDRIEALRDGPVARMPDPEEIAESRELGEQIRGVLEMLSTDRRRAVRAHLAGFTVGEIMEMFHWPYNRARNLIARGMADLRRGLRARGIDG